jgi:hypothetical protein
VRRNNDDLGRNRPTEVAQGATRRELDLRVVDRHEQGRTKTTDRWGPGAKGLIMFDASGRYSFLISRASIPKFASNNVNQGTAEENKAVVQGLIAYIGTWSVDEASKTLITNIEAG